MRGSLFYYRTAMPRYATGFSYAGATWHHDILWFWFRVAASPALALPPLAHCTTMVWLPSTNATPWHAGFHRFAAGPPRAARRFIFYTACQQSLQFCTLPLPCYASRVYYLFCLLLLPPPFLPLPLRCHTRLRSTVYTDAGFAPRSHGLPALRLHPTTLPRTGTTPFYRAFGRRLRTTSWMLVLPGFAALNHAPACS